MGHVLTNAEKFEAGIAFGCEAPTVVPRSEPRYSVPSGTSCRVTPVAKIAWREYMTTKDLPFERYERYVKADEEYEFRHQGWLIRVWRKHILFRSKK